MYMLAHRLQIHVVQGSDVQLTLMWYHGCDSEEKNDIRKKNQDNQNNEYTSKVVVNNNLM